jgi:L-serine dehydratase
MHISVFDLFKIGIGPSSSHTVGPMNAARRFAERLDEEGLLSRVSGVKVELFGSLGFTGKGHGSDLAVMLGLEGESPRTVDIDGVTERVERITKAASLQVLGKKSVAFKPSDAIVFHRREKLPLHSNGMRFTALEGDRPLAQRIFYSVGGGFIVNAEGVAEGGVAERDAKPLPYPFDSGDSLLQQCNAHGLAISTLMLENEKSQRSEIRSGIREIAQAMEACVKRGCEREGILPGGLKVKRRAATLSRRLKSDARGMADPLIIIDWVNLWALAVNEENAAGGRVVTAPTNGAAGIIPAVLTYYLRFGDRRALQEERIHLRRGGGVSGRGRRGVLDGGRRVDRSDGRHAGAGRERRGDRHGTQPRAHLRPHRRAGAGAVHRAQRDGQREGDQRGAARAVR